MTELIVYETYITIKTKNSNDDRPPVFKFYIPKHNITKVQVKRDDIIIYYGHHDDLYFKVNWKNDSIIPGITEFGETFKNTDELAYFVINNTN